MNHEEECRMKIGEWLTLDRTFTDDNMIFLKHLGVNAISSLSYDFFNDPYL